MKSSAPLKNPAYDSYEIFNALSLLDSDDPHRVWLRQQIVETHLPLVRFLVQRYRNLGEPIEDLLQIGTIGLIHAVDRFDPERGTTFASFATPNITGEIKRHFRDRAWAVRIPRRLQEFQHQLNTANSILSQRLGRAPTVRELAAQAGIHEEAALEALEAQRTCIPVPIDFQDHGSEGAMIFMDSGLDGVIDREALRPLLQQLSAREKRILILRFFRGLTQDEIAQELGISQMHVSRLLAQTVARLRRGLDEPA